MSSEALIVIGFFIYFAAVAIPILSARKQKTLFRKQYAIRSSIVVAVMIAANLAFEYEPTDFYDLDGSALALQISWKAVLFIVDLFCTAILTLWSVHRLQHIGWSKWWCLLFVIPMLGLVFWIILMVQQPRQPIAPSVTDEETPSPYPSS